MIPHRAPFFARNDRSFTKFVDETIGKGDETVFPPPRKQVETVTD
jgi:hypothetical protein